MAIAPIAGIGRHMNLANRWTGSSLGTSVVTLAGPKAVLVAPLVTAGPGLAPLKAGSACFTASTRPQSRATMPINTMAMASLIMSSDVMRAP